MGNTTSQHSWDVVHTAPVFQGGSQSSKNPNRSPVYRAASHPSELVSGLVEGGIDNAYEIFQRGCRMSRTRPCLGKRKRDGVDGPMLPVYEWWTYGEVELMAQMLGSGIIHRDLVHEVYHPEEAYPPAQRLRILGICSKNRVEWFITDLACNAYSMTLCPLYDTLGDAALLHMLETTQMSCVAGAEANLMQIMKLIKSQSKRKDKLTSVICFDDITKDLTDLATSIDVQLHHWVPLMDEGTSEGMVPLRLPRREDVATICFTSGTTGVPKGAILTHGAFASTVCAAMRGPMTQQGLTVSQDDLYISYLPLAHVFERILTDLVFVSGGKIAIYSGEARTLLDDIKCAQPTIFASVPRLFMRINDKILAGVKENSAVARYLFNLGMSAKIDNLRQTGSVNYPLWDMIVFNKVKALMGGRLRYMLSGGAALEKSVQERMAVLFGAPLLEGYGLTETMGATFIRRADDGIYGHIGSPLPTCEMCLESVPEMKYLVTDAEPRGELLLRGNAVLPNYYLNPEATASVMTEDGWFRTGDIAVRLELGGRIKIIDRKKNIFKMSQGEYVAPDRIEQIYTQAPLIAQMFAYGDSNRVNLVAIICVEEEEAKKLAATKPELRDLPLEKLVLTAAFKSQLQTEMDERADALGLKGFEKIRAFHIETEQFSADNGLLTPTLKLKRAAARDKYLTIIEQLYATLAPQ